MAFNLLTAFQGNTHASFIRFLFDKILMVVMFGDHFHGTLSVRGLVYISFELF